MLEFSIKNPNHLVEESFWLDGLVTFDGTPYGSNALGNVDGRVSGIKTLNQIEIEGKHPTSDGLVRMTKGQFLDKMVEFQKNPTKEQHMLIYDDWRLNSSKSFCKILDLKPYLKAGISYHDPFQVFDPEDMINATRQDYNKLVHDWIFNKSRKIDLGQIERKPKNLDFYI